MDWLCEYNIFRRPVFNCSLEWIYLGSGWQVGYKYTGIFSQWYNMVTNYSYRRYYIL